MYMCIMDDGFGMAAGSTRKRTSRGMLDKATLAPMPVFIFKAGARRRRAMAQRLVAAAYVLLYDLAFLEAWVLLQLEPIFFALTFRL